MKVFLIALGFLTLALGTVGVLLPILPTTPFYLVSAVCFAKSSSRLNRWFRGTKLYQKNLATLAHGRGMTRRAKLRIMTTVTIIMAVAFWVMDDVPVGRICLGVVWIAHVIAFCFFVKTCPPQEAAALEENGHDDP